MGNIFIWWPSYIIADNYWTVSILIKVMPCLYMSFIYLLTVRFNAKWEGFFSRNNCMETKVCLLQYILNADTLHFQRINTKKRYHCDSYLFQIELYKQKAMSIWMAFFRVQLNFKASDDGISVDHFDSYSDSSLK